MIAWILNYISFYCVWVCVWERKQRSFILLHSIGVRREGHGRSEIRKWTTELEKRENTQYELNYPAYSSKMRTKSKKKSTDNNENIHYNRLQWSTSFRLRFTGALKYKIFASLSRLFHFPFVISEVSHTNVPSFVAHLSILSIIVHKCVIKSNIYFRLV